MKATIDGTEVEIVEVGSNGYLPTIRTTEQEYVCAIDEVEAGEKAITYWNVTYPDASPSSDFDTYAKRYPAQTWASDGQVFEATTDSEDLMDALGFRCFDDLPFVVYPQ